MKKYFDRAAMELPLKPSLGLQGYTDMAHALDGAGRFEDSAKLVAAGLEQYPHSPHLWHARAANLRASGAPAEETLAAFQTAYEKCLLPRYRMQDDLNTLPIAYADFLRQSRVLGPRTMMAAERVLLNYTRTRSELQPDVMAALGDLYLNLKQKGLGLACYAQAASLPDCPKSASDRYRQLLKDGQRYSAAAWETIEGRIDRSGDAAHQPPLPPPSARPFS